MVEILKGKIKSCRICNGNVSSPVVDLGELALTGMFGGVEEAIPKCSLSLTRCTNEACGLLQLLEEYDLDCLYGDGYGYASSLNASMVAHLERKAEENKEKVSLSSGDTVIDIGSNDATSLAFFPREVRRIGVDAVGKKYRQNYERIGAELIEGFYPSDEVDDALNGSKAKLISSYSCFYDLPEPLVFAAAIANHLAIDGIWALEQSYLGAMLEKNSFDTICHEHIEYYRLYDIHNICRSVGLKIIDVSMNSINGGSFSVQVAHESSDFVPSSNVLELLEVERNTDWPKEIAEFAKNIEVTKEKLVKMLDELIGEGNTVSGLGASTKGNVLLQYYNLNQDYIKSIGEINEDKVGCVTPGTNIPIVAEEDLLNQRPDYLLVLPWHFKEHFLTHKKYKGVKFIFPLPSPEIVHNL